MLQGISLKKGERERERERKREREREKERETRKCSHKLKYRVILSGGNV